MGIDNRPHLCHRHGPRAGRLRDRRASFSAARANFDPTIGPARLIYAFEAVIIGGLGSLWGTLAGGIVVGVAQTIGARDQSGMADPRRAPRLPRRPRHPAARPLPARGRLRRRWPTRRQPPIAAASRVARRRRALVALPRWPLVVAVARRRCRPSPAARRSRTCSSSSPCWRWRSTGTCSPAMPAWSRSASRPSSASAPTRCSPRRSSLGLDPLLAILLGGIVAARPRRADGAHRLPPARRLFRHRHLGGGRGLPPDPRAGEAARRRHRHLARPGRSPTPWPASTGSPRLFGVRTPAARDIAAYWLALAAPRRDAGAGLSAAPLAPRPGARRHPRLGGGRRQPRRRRVPHASSSVYVLAAFGTGMIGALIYLQKARISPDAAFSVLDWTAYVIFIVVIGGIGTMEGPIIGAIVLYLPPGLSRRLRHLVPDHARRARGHRHAVRAARPLGLRRRPARLAALPGQAAAAPGHRDGAMTGKRLGCR